jgi:superfamily II DNA/RNA helicase
MSQSKRLAALNNFKVTLRAPAALCVQSVAAALAPNAAFVVCCKCTHRAAVVAASCLQAGTHTILLATDVASRGLDIPSVDLVVNFEIPRNSKDYIHRVGRTARAGRSGQSVTFVTQYDVELFQRIEELIGKKMVLYPTEEDIVLQLSDRVGEAQRVATQTLKNEMLRKNGKRGRDEEDAGDTVDHFENGSAVAHHNKKSFNKSQKSKPGGFKGNKKFGASAGAGKGR